VTGGKAQGDGEKAQGDGEKELRVTGEKAQGNGGKAQGERRKGAYRKKIVMLSGSETSSSKNSESFLLNIPLGSDSWTLRLRSG